MNVELSQDEIELLRQVLTDESGRLRRIVNDLTVISDCDPMLRKMNHRYTFQLGIVASLRVKMTTLAYEASHADEENLLEGDEEDE